MNTQQQAYIEGFVKRAGEYGLSHDEAIALLKSALDAAPVTTGTSATAKPAPTGTNWNQKILGALGMNTGAVDYPSMKGTEYKNTLRGGTASAK